MDNCVSKLRGRISDIQISEGISYIILYLPLKNSDNYINYLRSITSGDIKVEMNKWNPRSLIINILI